MRIDKNNWLIAKPIAHRGLWGGEIIENSIPAISTSNFLISAFFCTVSNIYTPLFYY